MAEADLGVRVFLIDNLSSPMGLITGSIAMLGSAIMSGLSQGEAMFAQWQKLSQEGAELRATLIELQDAEAVLNYGYAMGNIPLADYTQKLDENKAAQAEASAAVDENALATQNLQNDMLVLQGTLLTLGATLGAGIDFFAFADGIKQSDQAASDLQDTLMSLSIAGNLNTQQTQDMQKALFAVSQASTYTGDTVGQAFTMLMEKGQSATDVVNGLGQATVNMAMAMGENDATGAATLLSSALQMWNAKASDGAHYADMLTYAFYHGIPSVSGLTQALQQTGGMAAYLNIPMSEIITMLDALGRSGLTGSEAGSSLRYVLQSMYQPTQKEANELEYLGIITSKHATPAFEKFLNTMNAASAAAGSSSMRYDGTINSLYLIFKNAQQIGALPTSTTFLQWADSLGMVSNKFYDANGKQKDFLASVGELISAIKAHSKTPQEFADAMSQMFNVRSGRGFADLLTQFGGLSEQQKKLMESTYGQGLAAEDAAKKTSTQSAKQKELGTTFTDFMAQVGNPFPGIMTTMLGGLNSFFGGLTRGNGDLQRMAGTFLIAGAAMSGIALIVGLVVIVFTVLGGVLAPIIGVVLAVAAGIALMAVGIAAGVAFIQSHLKQVQAFLAPFIKMFQGLFKDLNFGATFDELKRAFVQLLPALKVVGMILGGVLLGVLGILVGLLVGLAYAVSFVAKGFATALTGAILVVTGILNVFTGIIKVVWGFLTTLFYLLTGQPGKATEAWHGMLQGFSQVGNGIRQIVTGMWDAIKGVFIGTIGAILGFLGGFIQGIINFFTGLANTLVHHSIIPDMINAIMQWFWKLFLIPGQLIAGLVGGILHMAGLLISAFQNGIISPLENLFKNLASQALVWGINLIQGFINGIGSMIGNVAHAASNVVNTVKNFLGFHSPAKEGPGSDADTWMPNLMHMLTVGITGGIPGMHNAASQAAGALQSGFYSPGMSRSSSSYAQANASINGGNTTVPINIDGQAVTTVVLNRLTGQVQMSGSGRLLR